MIVVPDKQAVILKVQIPERILNVVPTARSLGAHLVAVPHRIDEVRVLRSLGIGVPSPLRYQHPFPAPFPAFKAQEETADFLTFHHNAFVLNELGTGKTLAALWAYDYLRLIGEIKKALVVAPLSTLERVWADEIFNYFPHLTTITLHGTKERRLKLLAEKADLYIINHDGIKTQGFEQALSQRPDIDLVIVDEIAQVARNAGTDRWKALNRLVHKQGVARRVWGLTGTPTPNAPTDAWAQIKLVAPSRVPPYFNRFRDMVMRQLGPFSWVPRDTAVATLHEVMQPAVRFTREDCQDLPPVIYQTRTVSLSADQARAYKEMVQTLHAEAESGEILAVNEAVKMGKLLQIACGVAYDPNGQEVVFGDRTPRFELVKELIEEAGGKTIIFVPFVAAAKHLEVYLRSENFAVALVHGGVSSKARNEIFRLFQKTNELKVLVAQPAAMSHGLTLTAANTIVWYSAVTSNETYEQACARITRPGQTRTQFIINIEGSPIERRLYERLKKKQAMQGLLLQLVRESVY